MIIDTRLILATIAELIGLLAIVAGVALISIPAACIVGGVFAILVGLAIDPPSRVPKPPARSDE